MPSQKEGEKANKGSMRGVLLSAMAASGDEGVKKEALRLFNEYYAGGEEIAADIRKVVYKLAVSEDEDAVMPKMRALYLKTSFPEEQRNLMMAMGGCKGAGIWKDTIEWALWSGDVKKQDAVYPLSTLGGGGKGEMAFEFFKEVRRDKFATEWDADGLICLLTQTLAAELREAEGDVHRAYLGGRRGNVLQGGEGN